MPHQGRCGLHALPHSGAAELIAPLVGRLSKEWKEKIETGFESCHLLEITNFFLDVETRCAYFNSTVKLRCIWAEA
jgi:hypothetical protein